MTKIELEAPSQRSLTTALRQYSHNHGEGFVFGYDKEETDRIVAGLIEGRNQQYAMKVKAREQRDEAAAMLRELANATLDIIAISDRKHDAWDAAKAVIAKVMGDASLEVSCETKNLLNWSEEHEANESIRYNHILADSPIGQFSIEWKGWKEHDAMCVYLDGDYIDSVNTLEDAKLIAEKCISDKANQIIEFCAKAKVETNTCTTCNETGCEPRTDGEMHSCADCATKPTEQPAPDVANLIRLLDSARLYVADVLKDPYSDVSHSFAKADLDQIDAALATHRQQGGGA